MCEDLPGVFFEKCFPQCGQSSAFPARETGFFTASLDTRRCGFRPRTLVSFLFSTSGATVSFPSSSSSSVNKSSFSGSLAPLSPIIRFLRPLFSFLVFTSAIFCKCFSQNIAPITFSFEQRHTPFVRVHLKASGTLSFDFFVTFCVRMEARCSSSLSKSSILLAFFAPEPRALSLLVKFVAAGVKLTSSRSNLSASASSGVTRTLESRCFEDNFFFRKATSAA